MDVEGLWDPICGRAPKDIDEYHAYSGVEGITADDFVRREEGTLDEQTGFFACTDCYINIGMPSGERGWSASPANLQALGVVLVLPPGVAMPKHLS